MQMKTLLVLGRGVLSDVIQTPVMVENIVQNYILELQTGGLLSKSDEYEDNVDSNIKILNEFVGDLPYLYLSSSLKESQYQLPELYR